MEKTDSIRKILAKKEKGREQAAVGWVRTKRVSPNVFFLVLADGSTPATLQITGTPKPFQKDLERIQTGTSLRVTGRLVASPGRGQSCEIVAQDIEIMGDCDGSDYPIQPKKHSLEFLRSLPHLRVRTHLFGAIFRIRHLMSQAFHDFFSSNGFYHVHTPIITPSDCEGAGETFRVTSDDGQKEFFEEKVYLTVSGQLEAELLAMGLSKVYTFAPTFRAENSNTSRHLSEFWMIEPEMAFCDLSENIRVAESALKYVVGRVLKEGWEDIDLLHQRQEKENATKKEGARSMPLKEKLDFVVRSDWEEISYCEAYEILKASQPNRKGKFQYSVREWGQELQTEHERFLVEKHFKRPVVVRDYPKDIKAFYMRLNETKKTVAAVDILFPEVGEIAGGSPA